MDRQSVHASFHQGNHRYKDSSGKQCVAMVLSYLLYTQRVLCTNIVPQNLDTILDVGNALYMLVNSVVGEKYLLPTDLPTKLKFGVCDFSIDFKASICGVLSRDLKRPLQKDHCKRP